MSPLHVLMVTAEFAPWAKVGGLGDVTAALATELSGRGHQVKVVVPLYGHLDRKILGIRPLKKLPPLSLRIGQQMHDVRYHVLGRGTGRLQVILVECEALFGRSGIYNAAPNEVHLDAVERASLHAQAALLLPRLLDWPVDIIHAHDAHAAVAPLYRDLWYGRSLPGVAATVLTIHNLAHQEIHPAAMVETLGLPAGQAVYPGLLEFHGQINLMKAGILASDRVNTVSPTYARETVGDPDLGCGLQDVLAGRGKNFTGILNGADYKVWDPARDPALPVSYDVADLKGKDACRRALMAELGLASEESSSTGRLLRPLCGFVGRLVTQKGVDLLLPLLPRLVADGFSFAILGTGETRLENATRDLAKRHGDSIAFVDRYDDSLAHRIYAGCDVFLMPSLFEPCGLSQLYALRYGSPPVVRNTGGLADTVVPFPAAGATGFMFAEPRSEALLACLRQVEKSWQDPGAWAELQARGMAARFDWPFAVGGYESIYADALAHREEI